MAYFKDFTVCEYFQPCDEWLFRPIAIGWIERGKPYTRGENPPEIFTKLDNLRKESIASLHTTFRGLHCCSICERAEPLECSHVNLFIPHEGMVFLAPGRIDHFMEQHQYAPPESFVLAVMQCPLPGTEAYREKIRIANRGVDASSLFRGFYGRVHG